MQAATRPSSAPQRRRVAARPLQHAPVVKSAARALHILEHFDTVRGACCARDVAQALGYPQSSTQALLRSLVASGYLHCDQETKHYRPTLRVSLLGAGWIAPELCGSTALQQLVETIAKSTDGTACIVMRNGDVAESLLTSQRGELCMRGDAEPLTQGAAGRVLLMGADDGAVRRLLQRLNAEAAAQGMPRTDIAAFQDDLLRLRRRGWTEMTAHSGEVAMPLFRQQAGGPIALRVRVPAATLPARATSIARIMREACEATLRGSAFQAGFNQMVAACSAV